MTDPRRVARYCMVLAVATLYTVSQGEFGEAAVPASSLEDLPPTHIARRLASGRPSRPLLSQFTLGRLWLMRAVVEQEPLTQGRFVPSAWPEDLPTYRHRRRQSKRQKKSRAQRKRWQQQHRARNKLNERNNAFKNLPL
jgi:hypothetical protein